MKRPLKSPIKICVHINENMSKIGDTTATNRKAGTIYNRSKTESRLDISILIS